MAYFQYTAALRLWSCSILLALLSHLVQCSVKMDMVEIGNVGNAADSTGFGAVSYEYSVGMFEVTIGQYCEYLNGVASLEDTYLVYDAQMGENTQVAGIKRTASQDGIGFAYSVIDNQGDSVNRPIVYIDWFRAARFANWMSNGQPTGVLQDSSSTENGAYALLGRVDGNAVLMNSINPNTDAPPAYYIVRENEWYKAAYYNPNANDGKGGYYRFGTSNDTDPGNDIGSLPNQANYITLPDGFLSTTQNPDFSGDNYLTDGGAFTESSSAYGAFDMAGNVWEWCDLDISAGYRIFRGGAWTSYASYIASSYRIGALVNEAVLNGGFRLASQPGAIVFPDAAATPEPAPEPPSGPPPSGPALPVNDEMIRIEKVAVKNAGNIPEPATLFGSVSYEFDIGKYMVTIDQYCTFLNSVAKKDTYKLYNERMTSDLNVAGIERKGSDGSYSYSVMDNDGSSANRPISYVSFFDAARFANWMSNGQPIGDQDERTTEAGAYPLYGVIDGVVPSKSAVNPNTGSPPEYYIPLESEWYKAGFFDPDLSNGAGGYWTYATQSNSQPGNKVGPDSNSCNYIADSLYSVTQSVQYVASENYLSDVGAFTKSPSYYKTFDQNGNLGEWNNADGFPSSSMGTRGNFWASGLAGLRAFAYVSASQESNDLGFRIASPKESSIPSTPSPCMATKIDPGCTCEKPFWHPAKKECIVQAAP